MTRRACGALGMILLLGGCRNGDAARQADRVEPDSSTPHRPGTPRPAADAPYEIVSPAAGVTWYEDSSYTIRWRAPVGQAVNVGAVMGGKDRGHLAMSLPVGSDSLRWHIPPGFVTGFGPARSDAMRFRVESAADPSVGVTGAAFSIAGTPHGKP